MPDQPQRHSPLIVIPARLAATRLPGKPLALIQGEAMILHVWRRAIAANLGPVLVACGDEAIADVIRAAGGQAILTDPALPSGSDRVWQAVCRFDPAGAHDVVINVQGDLPTLDPTLIKDALSPLVTDPAVDIATLVAPIVDEDEKTRPSVVKAVIHWHDRGTGTAGQQGRCLYFSRATVPTGPGPLFHHIGLYAYRRAALERFVALPQGQLERRESLEQLRALEAGMRIDATSVATVPLGVDTPNDLIQAERILSRP